MYSADLMASVGGAAGAPVGERGCGSVGGSRPPVAPIATPCLRGTTLLMQIHNPVAIAWAREHGRRCVTLADPGSRARLADRILRKDFGGCHYRSCTPPQRLTDHPN
jgi:hypothetical protein